MDLQIVTIDISGEFTPTRYFMPTFCNARITRRDGTQDVANIAFSKELLAKLQTRSDLTSVTVEIEGPGNTTLSYVRQVFLPGEDIVPTRIGAANEYGEVSYLRRLNDEIEVGRTSSDLSGEAFRLRDNGSMITIDGFDCENQVYFSAGMLDEMIDGLIMMRAKRTGGTSPSAPSDAPAPASYDHLVEVIAAVAQDDPRAAYEAVMAASKAGPSRNAGDLANDACHFDVDGNRLSPTLGWITGEGDGAIAVFVYADSTVTAKIVGSETKLVHCPNVIMGSPYFVSDPTFDPLRITGRFDEIDDYETMGLYEALVREKLIAADMPITAFDRWLTLHGANETLQSTYFERDPAA